MPMTATAGTARSLSFLGALLLGLAFSWPAYAQIETVVVTAERKAEDIQTVDGQGPEGQADYELP